MKILRFFERTPAITTGDLQKFLDTHKAGTYNLIDVRQESEYRKGHLPGALLIPVSEINARLDEIDPERPTIVY
jgi:rhodanese-related sulfurtransferase